MTTSHERRVGVRKTPKEHFLISRRGHVFLYKSSLEWAHARVSCGDWWLLIGNEYRYCLMTVSCIISSFLFSLWYSCIISDACITYHFIWTLLTLGLIPVLLNGRKVPAHIRERLDKAVVYSIKYIFWSHTNFFNSSWIWPLSNFSIDSP